MSVACGTRSAYNGGCRCIACRQAQADYSRIRRDAAKARAIAEGIAKPKRVRRLRVGKVVESSAPVEPMKVKGAFEAQFVFVTPAMTLEEWRAREAARPDCRPVTQPPIRLRHETMPDPSDRLSVIDTFVATLEDKP